MIKKRLVSFFVVLGFCLLVFVPAIQAQEVKIRLDESTYGIDTQKLNTVANSLINENLAALKSKSLRVLADVKATDENYETGALNYEMTVIFLHKDTYTAEVKRITFSLVNGQKMNIKVMDEPLIKLIHVQKIPIRLSCKLKQGLIIKPLGILEMEKVGMTVPGRTIEARPMAERRVIERRPAIMDLQRAELFPLIWWYAKGLATTPCDYIPTAVSGTQDVYQTFTTAFGRGNAAMRLGDKCTVNTVSTFLKYDSKLLAWNHIGHGWPGGIVLWDASLDAAIIQGFTIHKGIYCAVALINSCNTFNDPLKAAFLGNNPRTFIAGAISLPIGPSEQVDMCFWKEVLLNKKTMSDALNTCSTAQGLAGAFGLSGDGGLFF